MVIVTVEGGDLAGFMRDLATSREPFQRWMREQLLAIEGIDFSRAGTPPALIADSGDTPVS